MLPHSAAIVAELLDHRLHNIKTLHFRCCLLCREFIKYEWKHIFDHCAVITCEKAGFELVLQLLRRDIELVIFWRSEVNRKVARDLVENVLDELLELALLDRLRVLLAKVEKDEMQQIVHDKQISRITLALNCRQDTRNIKARIQFLQKIAFQMW